MKSELPCHIVRDLLPSYLEGLTEAETTAAVKEHLDACPDCKARYASMVEVAGVEPAAPETVEVDYLKTVRRKTHRKILIAAILAVVLVLSVVTARFFLIGWVCDGSALAVTPTLSQDGTNLTLDFQNTSSATVIRGWNLETDEDGVVSLTARETLASPFRDNEEAVTMSLPLAGVSRVEVCGTTIYQEGVLIAPSTRFLLDHKIAYTGDAAGVGALVSALDLDVSASLELQTAQEPYGLTLHFTAPIEEGRRALNGEAAACVLLALVDNLGEVSWDDPRGWSGSLTLAQAEELLGHPVKDFGTDAASLQRLRDQVGI